MQSVHFPAAIYYEGAPNFDLNTASLGIGVEGSNCSRGWLCESGMLMFVVRILGGLNPGSMLEGRHEESAVPTTVSNGDAVGLGTAQTQH